MADLLAIDKLTRRLRRGRRARRGLAHARRRPGARAARPQRHGQDHADQFDRRRDPLFRRHDPARRPRHHARCAPTSGRMPASAGCRRSATSSSRSPSRRTSPRSRGRAAGRWRKVYELFPRLAERQRNLGNQLSGGEQQMLAVGRALGPQSARHPARRAARRAGADHRRGTARARCSRIVREEGMSAILVEQNAQKILGVTDRAAILERGSVVHEGESGQLIADRRCSKAISASPPPAPARAPARGIETALNLSLARRVPPPARPWSRRLARGNRLRRRRDQLPGGSG